MRLRTIDRGTELLQRVVDVRQDEVRALLLSGLYFFCLLSGYYIIRPMREQMGVAGGVRNLPWLYTATMVAMLLVHPPFAGLVSRLTRTRFIPLVYRFFIVNILIFFTLFLTLGDAQLLWVGRVFYVWTSVFNLFVISVFWAFMVDVFTTGQGKRLFGFIGLGGTLGGITGAFVTATFAERVGPVYLLLVSALLLELAVHIVRQLSGRPRVSSAAPSTTQTQTPHIVGGNAFGGIAHVIRSPYLLGICAYMLLFTLGSTVLYFIQADIADRTFQDRGAMTAFFAKIDLAVNTLTLATQAFLTGRVIKALGVALTLAILPTLTIVGFLSLGMVPMIGAFVVFQVFRRSGEYSLARPARELLYTVVSREDKYKAKHFIDTFVYRGGDQVGAWGYAAMTAVGLTITGTAFAAAPLAAVWLVVSVWLGRKQERMAPGAEKMAEA